MPVPKNRDSLPLAKTTSTGLPSVPEQRDTRHPHSGNGLDRSANANTLSYQSFRTAGVDPQEKSGAQTGDQKFGHSPTVAFESVRHCVDSRRLRQPPKGGWRCQLRSGPAWAMSASDCSCVTGTANPERRVSRSAVLLKRRQSVLQARACVPASPR